MTKQEGQPNLTSQMELVAEMAWSKSSLKSEYALDFLEHTAAEDRSGVFYCPRVFCLNNEPILELTAVLIRKPDHSFSIPASFLSGIFLDFAQNRIILAFRDVDRFYADGKKSKLPYDQYSISDNTTQFAITYKNLADGRPYIINDDVIRKATSAG